jgi:hypothetical protein
MACAWLALLWPPTLDVAEQAAAAEKKDVTVTLKIIDKTSGLTLEAKKTVPRDSNAFDVLRHTVALAYKTDAEGGPVVTSLCGVSPLKGLAWTCAIDGKPCKTIGRATLTADAVIEWKTEKTDAK